MLLKYFYDKHLAQASYLVGCPECGEALVIDPSRLIEPYLKAAADEGLTITSVTETHIHADFASGIRELAYATGARLYLSDMGNADWKYTFPASDPITYLKDRDIWMVGNVKVEVLFTPGHTPEHIAFMITDTKTADKPIAIFTGDFLFVGDVGRPDLLDEAAGMTGTREIGARQLFHTIQTFKTKPDYLQILPGHGAGSACGKALGALPSTTLGYEKLFNPAFQIDTEDAFVAWLLDGQPEAPRYFSQMKKVNKTGLPLLEELPTVKRLKAGELAGALEKKHLMIDYRNRDAFAQGHLAGTISIPATSNNLLTYTGWFVDYDTPLYLIVHEEKDVYWIIEALRTIGVDNIGGYFTQDIIPADAPTLPTLKAEDIASLTNALVLDVRSLTEYQTSHIEDAKHMMLGHLPNRLGELPQDRPIVIHCQTGLRAQIATSYLRRQGFENICSLDDTFENLQAVARPTK